MISHLISPTRLFAFICIFVVGCIVPNRALSSETISLFLGEVIDSKGQQMPVAADVEKIVRYVEAETGLKFQIKLLPWRRAQLLVKNGDGIIYGFSKSPERVDFFDFSLPVVVEKVWAITADNGDAKITTVNTLIGKTISIERGVSHGFEFEKAKNLVFRVDEDTASVELRFKKLFAGRSDALFWQARQFRRAKELEDFLIHDVFTNFVDRELAQKKITISPEPLYFDAVHFACAKGKYRKEIAKINTAITQGKINGKLTAILEAR
jgi:polar amino acid transport system substrate-binding protein